MADFALYIECSNSIYRYLEPRIPYNIDEGFLDEVADNVIAHAPAMKLLHVYNTIVLWKMWSYEDTEMMRLQFWRSYNLDLTLTWIKIQISLSEMFINIKRYAEGVAGSHVS